MNNKITEKKNVRISQQQKEKLVDYMSNNLEFARGQFGGITSSITTRKQWEELQSLLNALGGSAQSVEQWEKCWADLKADAKKYANYRRSIMKKTRGGSRSEVPHELNSFEKKILTIMTVDAIDGDSQTVESGFEDSMTSIEHSEDELPPRAKVRKTVNPMVPKSSANYKESLDEPFSRFMEKLEKIEMQNNEILSKIESLERILNKLPK